MSNNSQVPLVEEFGVSKTLLSQISNSPYFKKFDSKVFSKILFKPGYPLQSVELIELQDILQEQIRRFGNHTFKDGSIVTSSGGIDTYDCRLFELNEYANETPTVSETDLIVFVDRINNNEIQKAKFVSIRSAEIKDGVIRRTLLGVEFTDGLIEYPVAAVGEVDVFVQDISGNNIEQIGTLRTHQSKNGLYAHIKNNTFYVSGYFTNIAEQKYIFAVDDVTRMSVEVGVELFWKIVDVHDDQFGEQLYDPSQFSVNDNTPGADRLILQLRLKSHDIDYVQEETDWKFIPLLKYSEGKIVYRVKYPFYSVLGDTLARRTYEINGNFVVDPFKLEVRSDLPLEGKHFISQFQITGDVTTYTIEGENTKYKSLQVGNYVMFGLEINYNRLLLITEIESDTRMKLSDIHYDKFLDQNKPQLLTAAKVGQYIELRDENKLNYVLSEGKAYVKGYRFETTFNTRLEDIKARNTTDGDSSIHPNQHYFELDEFAHSQHTIRFDQLEELDLHCTKNSSLYDLIITQAGNFSVPLPINEGEYIQIDTNGAIFQSTDGLKRYRLVAQTKNNSIGVPVTGTYTISNLSNGASGSYTLSQIDFVTTTPYARDMAENYAAVTMSSLTVSYHGSPDVVFQTGAGTFDTHFANNDIVIIQDEITQEQYTARVTDVQPLDTYMEVHTFADLLDPSNMFSITKPSYHDFYSKQYESTRIGKIRANYVDVVQPEIFHFSHYEMIQPFHFLVADFTSPSSFVTYSLDLSFADGAYENMYIENNGQRWRIKKYTGATQEFELDDISITNPLNFSELDVVELKYNTKHINSISKSSYVNGLEYWGNIKKNSFDEPEIRTPNQTQKKFVTIINDGDGEIKNVNVTNYKLFYQEHWIVSSGNTNTLSQNIGIKYQENYNIPNSDVKVYASDTIYDTLNTGNIMYYKGEEIPISSVNISGHIMTINFMDTFVVNDAFIVHANIPVNIPAPKTKDLTTFTDTFTVNVDVASKMMIVDNNRYHGSLVPEFELKHSDLYRIRKISVGIGKTAPLVDLTDYFNLDNGQKETHYDYGKIILKPYLTMPDIVGINTTNAFYYFEVEYDYFKSSTGHYATVDSYVDIHYRSIPTYADPIRKKFPLRNVIDFRPSRKPKGELYAFQQEQVVVSTVYYDFTHYNNEEKVISIDGNGSSDIQLAFENEKDYEASDFNIKLYNLTMPAYTFRFDDVTYKMIDNRNYTMKDISKLQKRIENLEDIVQLNALELQALQTNITDSAGDERHMNGLIVDMFAGFAIADVDQPGFSASVDMKNMKMYPSFYAHNTLLEPSASAIINSDYPRVRNNIITLPITGHIQKTNTVLSGQNTRKSTQINLVNGQLSLHPFSDTWYSQSTLPSVLLNEDNQYKNWTQIGTQGFNTQWNMWEQYWSGVDIDENPYAIQNATLSQKTGQMVNNKNNIEKIIGDKKINTTLSLKNREMRIGFVLKMLKYDIEEYEIYINGSVVGFNQGQRLYFESSGTTPKHDFVHKYLNYELVQPLGALGTAYGTIRDIQFDQTVLGKDYYWLYITNITEELFQVNRPISNFVGKITQEHTFSSLYLDDRSNMCGDITINDGDYATNTSLEVQIRRKAGAKYTVASNRFPIAGLLETKTSFSQSVRPVQRKLFSNDENVYIDDKTFIINSTTRVKNPIHQPFIFDESCFISRISLRLKNNSPNAEKLIFTIQPMVNDNLSPSLVLPFTEQVITLAAGFDNEYFIEFPVPIFIPSNTEYSLVLRSEANIEVYTNNGTNNILVDSCIPALQQTGNGSEVIQCRIYCAQFDTSEKIIKLYIGDNNFNHFVDRYRLNYNSLKLTDTYTEFEWKARNHDTSVPDVLYKTAKPNQTTLLEKRKIFSPNDYELVCKIRSNDSRYSPVVDLERLSLTTVQHNINAGKLSAATVSSTRSGLDANLVQITLEQDPIPNVYSGGICKLDVNSTGQIVSYYSDPNFLMYSPDYDITVQKANSSTGVFESIPGVYIDPPTNTILANELMVSLDVKSEFDPQYNGSAYYRYFSPVVTLADDFEAMQLYVQMDAILKNNNDIFVYYRVLENTAPFNNFVTQPFKRIDCITGIADKYSNNNQAKTIEFETNRVSPDPRFKYFQIKICFTSTNFVDVPIAENVRILALDN